MLRFNCFTNNIRQGSFATDVKCSPNHPYHEMGPKDASGTNFLNCDLPLPHMPGAAYMPSMGVKIFTEQRHVCQDYSAVSRICSFRSACQTHVQGARHDGVVRMHLKHT